LYSFNVGVGLTALAGLRVPVYGALKRLTVIATLIGEYLVLHRVPSKAIVQSISVIVAGVLLMGAGDLEFNLQAYFAVFVSCTTQASFLLILKKTSIEKDMTTYGLLFYNSILSLPFLITLSLVTGDVHRALEYPHLWQIDFQICLGVSVILGFVLNFAMFWCTIINSPLDLTVAGQFKAISQTIVGLFLFGGIKLTLLNTIGLVVNTIGGLWYARIKTTEIGHGGKDGGAEGGIVVDKAEGKDVEEGK